MKKIRYLYISIANIILFVLWTIAVCFIDVKAVGPENSLVGFSTLNTLFHKTVGVNMWLYTVTDWLSIFPLCIVIGFALLGLLQLIKRKNLFRVDYDILMLGIFYIVVFSVFIFFEVFPVNYRPVLIKGILEASYPSSTTTLVLCVMPTAYMQLNNRITNIKLKKYVLVFIITFTVFMVSGRVLSGVHWITDIIGGCLISFGLVNMYRFLTDIKTDL